MPESTIATPVYTYKAHPCYESGTEVIGRNALYQQATGLLHDRTAHRHSCNLKPCKRRNSAPRKSTEYNNCARESQFKERKRFPQLSAA